MYVSGEYMSKLEDYISKQQTLKAFGGEESPGSVRWYIKWYSDRYPTARIKYRVAGVGILLLALVAAVKFIDESWLTLASLGAVAAVLFSFNAFFGWGSAWRGYFQTKVRLEFLIDGYDAVLIDARAQVDESKAIELVRMGVSHFLEKAEEAIAEEIKGYWEGLKFPSFKDIKG